MSKVVRFRADRARYAVPVEYVERVHAVASLIPLPHPNDGVEGVLEVEGEPMPVLSILTKTARYVLELNVCSDRFGLLVDEVLDVFETAVSAVQAPPKGQARSLISGALPESEDALMTMLLDVDELAAWLTP